MDKNLIVIIAVLVFVAVVVGITFFINKEGKNSDKIVKIGGITSKVAKINDVAGTVAAVLIPFLPSPVNVYADLIFKTADKAVNFAENAWKLGNCEENKRKQLATNYINDALKKENIEIDDKTKRIIDIAIEVMVTTLEKSHT